MSGGGSSGNTNTVTQTIPAFEQQSSLENQALAQSLAAQPYPVYQGQLIQGFTDPQTEAQNMVLGGATSYQPTLNAATGITASTLGMSPGNAGNVAQFMSPYVENALAPQVQDLNIQLGQQQRAIDAQATQANAFGDARQGAQAALTNLYGDQAMNQLIGSGYNTAYNNAVNALTQQQQIQLATGQQLGTLAGQDQSLGLNAANAIYGVGQQQQTLQQNELNTAYQQFLNQVNWPFQMLNVRESALSNSPYNIATAVTLPNGNTAAQGFGALTALGGLLGGSGGSTGNNVFGGTK